MSNTVWYISFSKKKIEFKKYPKKKKKKTRSSSRLKSFLFNLMFLATIIFFANLVSADPINDTFHINLQTTFSNGSIQTGTFNFAFNITDNSSSSCNPNLVYNYSTSLATDSRGIISLYLPQNGSNGGNLSTLNYDKQYYLCYYRDGVLKDVSQLGRVPYSFRATQVNLSEITVNTNFNLSNFNLTNINYGFFSNIGINTTSPQNTLNVVGDINGTKGVFSQNNNLSIGYNYAVNGSTFALNYSNFSNIYAMEYNGTLATWANVVNGTTAVTNAANTFGNFNQTFNGTTFFINANNNRVGINTTTPQNILNVVGDANFTGNVYTGNITANNSNNFGGHLPGFYMPLNTSVYGNFDFNGGWTAGGFSISGGNIFAQTGFFYNISSINVTNMNVNGSFIPLFDNQFDLGNSTIRWRNIYGITINGTTVYSGNNNLTTAYNYAINGSTFALNYTNFSTIYGYSLNASLWSLNFSNFSTLYANSFSYYNSSTTPYIINWSQALNGTLATWAEAVNGSLITPTQLSNGTVILGTNVTYAYSLNETNWYSNNTGYFKSNNSKIDLNITNGYFNISNQTTSSLFFLNGTNGNITFSGGFNVTNPALSTLFFINPNGNVGIGTTGPTANLDIAGSSILWTTSSWGKAFQLANANVIKWGGNAGGTRHAIGQSTGGLFFLRSTADDNSAAATTDVTIDNTGNVGIGTTGPGAKLEVFNGGAAATGISDVQSTAALFERSAGGTLGLAFAHDNSANRPVIQSVSAGTAFSISINPYGGNVGIGTTSPNEILSVVSNGGTIEVRNNSGLLQGTRVVRLYVDSGAQIIAGGWNDSLRFGQTNPAVSLAVTGFTEYMRIQNGSGNVGIGTTTPTAKLQVQGLVGGNTSNILNFGGSSEFAPLEIQIPNTIDNKAFLAIHRTGTRVYQFGISGADLVIAGAGGAGNDSLQTERLRIQDGTGNVGIGTTTPTALEHLEASASGAVTTLLHLRNSAVKTGTAGVKIVLSPASNYVVGDNGAFISGYDIGGVAYMGLGAFNTGQIVTLKGDTGNVGIGTTTPQNKLNVVGGTLNVTDAVTPSDARDDLFSTLTTYASNSSAKAWTWRDGANITGQIDTRYNGTDVSMVFGHLYNSGYQVSDLMTIRGSGKVGIGTTAPTDFLDVKSSNSEIFIGTGSSGINVTNGGEPGISFNPLPNSGNEWKVGTSWGQGVNPGKFYIKDTTAGTYPFVIANSTGSVGINTTSPSTTLHVAGNARVTGILNVNANSFDATYPLDVGGNVRLQASGSLFFNNGLIQAALSQVAGATPGLTTAANVGIGNSTPVEKLVLNGGNFRLGADGEGRYIYYVSDVAGAVIINTTRSDKTQQGNFDSNGWGSFYTSRAFGVGGDPGPGSNIQLLIKGQGDGTPALNVTGSSTSTSMATISQDASGTNTGTLKLYSGNPAVLGTLISGGTADSYINGGGKVGIGNAAPGAKLDVSGGIWTSAAGSGRQATYDLAGGAVAAGSSFYSYGAICAGNALGTCTSTGGVTISPATAIGSPNVQIAGAANSFFNGGSVGIGTTTPQNTLNVVGTLNVTNGTNSVQGLIVDSTNKVGIGTTTSQSTLDLGSAVSGRSLVWGGPGGANWYSTIGTSYSSGSTNVLSGLKLSTGPLDQILFSYTGTIAASGTRWDPSSGDISFFNTPSASQTAGNVFDYAANTKLIIKSSGSVGIGTTSPLAKLDINGSAPYLQISTNGSAVGYIGTGDQLITGNVPADFAIRAQTGSLTFGLSNNEKMRINFTTGNVGIGTTTPQNTLNVVGTLNATSTTYLGGGSSGKAVCWKTATQIGFCSSVVDSTGACTCN